jgi:hypothetical protein
MSCDWRVRIQRFLPIQDDDPEEQGHFSSV